MSNLLLKWSCAFLVAQTLQVSAAEAQTNVFTYASVSGNIKSNQQATKPKMEGLKAEKLPLQSILMELSKNRDIYFLYTHQSMGSQLVTPVDVNKGSVEKILEQLLANTGFSFKKVNEKTFLIQATKESEPIASTTKAAAAYNNEDRAARAPYDLVKGKVTGANGSPLSGASVLIKSTKKGTSTSSDGEFSLNANTNDVLVISYVGYDTKEVVVTGGFLNIQLVVSQKLSNEVIVTTAMGIQRRTKDLTYATQRLTSADYNTVKDANFINSLSGKVAGVTITKSASGLGGSARVILRGNKSTRENQPLYLIDGVPLANFSPSQPTDVWGQSSGQGSGGRDGGDGISNLNPEDIESLTVLKGASGAALYGSAAANGAIVVTTRGGKAGRTRIGLSSNIMMEKPLYYPEAQFKYGQSGLGQEGYNQTARNSWGNPVNGVDFIKPFYQTGLSNMNTISLSTGTDKAQTYFSYGNVNAKSIVPTSRLTKNNITFRETAKLLNDKLTVDANIFFFQQKVENRPISGLYANPLTGLYTFPRGLDFDGYKNNYQIFSQRRNMMTQSWYDINSDAEMGGSDDQQNPYWILNKMPRVETRNRALTNLILKYTLNNWINVVAKGNFDKIFDSYDQKMHATTQSVQAALNGRYTQDKSTYTQLYGELMVNANKNLSDNLNLSVNLGSSIHNWNYENTFIDTNPDAIYGLTVPNKFGVGYIARDAMIVRPSALKKQVQSLFLNAQLSFKKYLYLDLTGRNDWSSSFAFTPTEKKGYFYYSVGSNFVFSDAFKLPTAISFGKVRVSYARVGNDLPPYITNPPNYYNTPSGVQVNGSVPYPGIALQPEDNRSFEVGTDIKFLKNRIGVDFTYYKNSNFRQYVEVSAPLGSGYSKYYLNLGNIQNSGFELMLYGVPFQSKKLSWTTSVNIASNKNKIVSLSMAGIAGADANNAFILTPIGVNMYQSEIRQGGSWGDIYGYTFQRASNGNILVDASGTPQKNNSLSLVGNPNPKYTIGWNNTFEMGNFTVNFLLSGRFGGKVMSVTQAVLDLYGDSKASAVARDNGGVNIAATNAVTNQAWTGLLPAQNFYSGVGGRAGISEYYMYDATNIRLRELAISYNIPVKVKGISELRVALIGNNLFFISKKAPFDPDISMATGNGLQGVETFGIPSTRAFGLSVNIGF